jgi:hypothetical protein
MQVVYHQLSLVFQHMFLTQGQNVPSAANHAAGMSFVGAAPVMGMQGAMPLQQQGAYASGMVQERATDIVFNWLKDHELPGSTEGVPEGNIISGLATRLQPDAVLEAIRQLVSGAKVYTTTDDQTYRTVTS